MFLSNYCKKKQHFLQNIENGRKTQNLELIGKSLSKHHINFVITDYNACHFTEKMA